MPGYLSKRLIIIAILCAISTAPAYGQTTALSPANAAQVKQIGILGMGMVHQMAWSPDGKVIAFASTVGVFLYDPAFKMPGQRLGGNRAEATEALSVAFSPDSSLLAVATADKTVQIWGMQNNGTPLMTLQGHTDRINSVVFNDDGRLLASVSDDGTLRIWTVKTGESHVIKPDDPTQLLSVSFNSNSSAIAAGGADGQVRVWDVESGKQLMVLGSPKAPKVVALAYNPDGKTLVSGELDGAIRQWSAKSGRLLKTRRDVRANLGSLAFNVKGSKLVYSSVNGEIWQWDQQTGYVAPLHNTKSQPTVYVGGYSRTMDPISSVAFGPDGVTVARANIYGNVWFGSLQARLKQVFTACPPDDGYLIAVSPDNKTLVYANVFDGVTLWDIPSRTRTTSWPNPSSNSVGFAISPDARLIASMVDDTVHLRDLTTGKDQVVAEGKGKINGFHDTLLTFTADSKTLIYRDAERGIMALDIATHHAVPVASDPDAGIGEYPLRTWSMTGDGKILATNYYSQDTGAIVVLEEVATGKFIAAPQARQGSTILFSPDGKQLAVLNYENEIDLWNTSTVQPPPKMDGSIFNSEKGTLYLKGHTDLVLSVAFSHDSQLLASGSLDNTIRLWDVSDGSTKNLLAGHNDTINALAFSPDDTMLASAGADCTIRLWGVG